MEGKGNGEKQRHKRRELTSLAWRLFGISPFLLSLDIPITTDSQNPLSRFHDPTFIVYLRKQMHLDASCVCLLEENFSFNTLIISIRPS